MSDESLVTSNELEWVYFTPDVISKLTNDNFIIELFRNVAPDKDYINNDGLAALFYEFLFLFSDFEKFSMKDGIYFIRKFLQQASPKSNYVQQDMAVAFIQMLNLFPTNMKIEALLKSLSILGRFTIVRYLKTEHLKVTKEIDNYPRKAALFLKEASKVKTYNLLHECSEGYAKLVVEVKDAISNPDAFFMIDNTNRLIGKLIGTYDLDPYRVLDILLDIMSSNLLTNYRFCVQLLRKSPWWPKEDSCHSIHHPELVGTGGSALAAQLLGFKILNFHFLKNKISETFKCLVAILIKEGFISLGAFYTYLPTENSDVDKLDDQFKEHMNDKIFKASASALSLAAPLKDDDDGTSTDIVVDQPQKKSVEEDLLSPLGTKVNYKYEFLKYLLLVGCYDESLFLLTRFPILAQINDEIPSLIHRLFHEMIDDLYYTKYHPVEKSAVEALISKVKQPVAKDYGMIDYEKSISTDIEIFKLHNSHAGKNFYFFYHEWKEGLPQVNSVEDLFRIANELLSFSGSKLSNDPELISKLVRIGIKDMTDNQQSGERLEQWFQFARKFFFTSIPLLGTNSPTVDQIFLLLQLFPIAKRFNLYGELEMKFKKRNLLINLEYDQATKKTKDGLKRLSKTNANVIMRGLSKISISNPLPFFQVIITQVESYDNLIDLIVQAARYFNAYAWDVLSYVLLTRLTSRRTFVQKDGLNDRLWLQNLSCFIGKLCLNFSNRFNSKILTEFVVKKLYEFDNISIPLYKEILNNVSGIASITNLTAKQIELLNSASSVAKTVYKVILDKRYTPLNTKASLKYLSNLAEDSAPQELSKLSEIFILLTNYYRRQIFLERTNENHSKILSNRNDELSGLIHTYIQTLNYFAPDLSKNLISLEKFLSQYNVDVEWAFALWRQSLSAKIVEEYEIGQTNSPWSKFLSPIMQLVQKLPSLQSIDWEYLNTGLYVSFWQLSLYDINYEESNYDIKDKLRQSIRIAENTINDSSALKKVVREKVIQKRELEGILKTVDSDCEAHAKHDKIVRRRIDLEKKHWFDENENISQQAEQFTEHCLLPRIIHSSFDAVFCAKFVILLLEIGFKQLFHEILKILFSKVISTTIFTSTPLESENFGLFFSKIFEFLNSLRNKSTYNRVVQLYDDSDVTMNSDDESKEDIAYNEFTTGLFNWHKATVSEIISCLKNHDYMFRRNSITFLKNLLGVFPSVDDHCEEILLYLEDIFKNDEREDIRLSSNALIGHIKSRKSDWIHVYDFYKMPNDEKASYLEHQEKVSLETKQLEDQLKQLEKLKQEELAKAKDLDEGDAEEERKRILQEKAEAEAAAAATAAEEASKLVPEKAQGKALGEDVDMEIGENDSGKVEHLSETDTQDGYKVEDADDTNLDTYIPRVTEDESQNEEDDKTNINQDINETEHVTNTENLPVLSSNDPQRTILSPKSPRTKPAKLSNDFRASLPSAPQDRGSKFVDVMAGTRGPNATSKRPRESSVDKSAEDNSFKKRKVDEPSSRPSSSNTYDSPNSYRPGSSGSSKGTASATATDQISAILDAIDLNSYTDVIRAIPNTYRKYSLDLKQLQNDMRSSYGKNRISRKFADLIDEMSKEKDVSSVLRRKAIAKFEDYLYSDTSAPYNDKKSGRGNGQNETRNRVAREKEYSKSRSQKDIKSGGYPKKDSYRSSGSSSRSLTPRSNSNFYGSGSGGRSSGYKGLYQGKK